MGSCVNAAAWAVGVMYTPGALVSDQGMIYRCLQANLSQPGWEPVSTPSLWQPTGQVACGTMGCFSGGGTAGSSGSSASGGTSSSGAGGGAGASGAGGASAGGSGTGGAAGAAGAGGATGMLFVGYFQSWSEMWQPTLPAVPGYVNVVNLSFMQPDTTYVAGSGSTTGTGLNFPYDGPTLKMAIAKLHSSQPGTKVMVSVGGATYTNWASFAPTAVAAFVSDFGLDGVDLDYEPASPNCSSSGGVVSCPSDSEYVSVVTSMRAAMPSPSWLSIAAFSVGAYGEGNWANATPASPSTGIALAVLKNSTASAALDLVNVMSYDASDAYDPVQALAAYQYYFSGRVAMGIEVPNEAWGGHVETLMQVDTLAAAVKSSHGAGLMLWSMQKPSDTSTTTQQFATEMCTQLGLSNCSAPL